MRGSIAIAGLVLFILVAGTFAWMTNYPDARILEQAEGWPGVGGFVSWFRERYVSPEMGEGGTDLPVFPLPGTPNDPSDAFPPLEALPSPTGARPFVWVGEDARLRAADRADAEVVHEFTEPQRMTVLERRGDWYRVLAGASRVWTVGQKEPIGWIHLPGYDELSDPPFGSEPARLGPLPPTPPDGELLASARRLLDGEREWRVGPYRLYSDGGDAELFAWLDRVVTGLEPAYVARYGLDPLGEAQEAIVLFREESQYRAFQASQGRIAHIAAGGHAFRGLAATWIGERPRAILGGVVLHELVHLVNRRALGPALPPWLDEGIAEDIAISELSPEGEILLDRIGGSRESIGASTVLMEGGLGSVVLLQREFGRDRVPPLDQVLTADWDAFVGAGGRDLHYAYAGLWLRHLQRSSEGSRGLREFLLGVARGENAAGSVLLSALQESPESLSSSFKDWVYEIHVPLEADS